MGLISSLASAFAPTAGKVAGKVIGSAVQGKKPPAGTLAPISRTLSGAAGALGSGITAVSDTAFGAAPAAPKTLTLQGTPGAPPPPLPPARFASYGPSSARPAQARSTPSAGGGGSSFSGTSITTPRTPQLPAGVPAGLQQLVGAYNQSFQEANAANEERYQRLLRISGRAERRTAGTRRRSLREAQREQGRQKRMGRKDLRDISRTTGQRERDIRESGREEQIRQRALLQRQGMGGTTVGITAGKGVRRETSAQLDRLADLMRGQRQGVRSEIAGRRERSQAGIQGLREQIAQQTPAARLGIMERRTDTGPDPSMLQNVFGQIGQGYGGEGLSALVGALGGMYGADTSGTNALGTGSDAFSGGMGGLEQAISGIARGNIRGTVPGGRRRV